MKGFIILHRKLLSWEWYDEPNTLRVFLHLLLKANHTDNVWRGIPIKRGQHLTSFDIISKELKLTIAKTRVAIRNLQKTGEIARSSGSQHTVFTVNNYDSYQDNSRQIACGIANVQQTNDKPIATNNNVNNENNENNENKPIPKDKSFACPTQEILKLWKEILPGKTQPRSFDGQRAKTLQARWNDGFKLRTFETNKEYYTDVETGLLWWKGFFGYIAGHHFLSGDKSNWLTLQWLTKKENFLKVVERTYDN